MIKILIVAPYPVIREGLKSLIMQHVDLQVSGEARFLSDALSQIRAQAPDVVLFDLEQLDDENGVSEILRTAPITKILALGESADNARVVNALAAGAKGYLARNASAQEMGHAIRAAHAGMLVLDSAAAAALLARTRPLSETEMVEPLTERELDVLRLMARGLPNKQIASELVITEHTVKFHISAILGKLQAANRTEAVSMALQQGLIAL